MLLNLVQVQYFKWLKVVSNQERDRDQDQVQDKMQIRTVVENRL